MRITS
ncbi:hypothetical protein Zm00014a_009287 [Zea mays]